MTTVVGFGQDAAGDDAIGLRVARALAAEGITARAASDATLLLSLFERDERVIIVDAVVAPLPVGCVVQLRPGALESAQVSPVSSHGLSVSQALELGRTLYPQAYAQVEIVAIVIARPRMRTSTLSERARAALDEACALVRRLYFAERAHGHQPNPGSQHTLL